MFSKKKVHFSAKSPQKSKENATLKDLCSEDKAKIGELMRKLAEEKGQKEQLLRELREKQRIFEQNLNEIRQENQQVALESVQLKEKFKESLNLLRNLQKNQGKHEISQKNAEKHQEMPKKPEFSSKIMSPKREILRISGNFFENSQNIRILAGESARKLQKLMENGENTNKTFEIPAVSWENLDKTHENEREISKLKEEIDNLAASLKQLKFVSESREPVENLPSKPTFLEKPAKSLENPTKLIEKPAKPGEFLENSSKSLEKPGKLAENSENNAKSGRFFENLRGIARNPVENPPITVIDEYFHEENEENEENSEETLENLEIARKWLQKRGKSSQIPSVFLENSPNSCKNTRKTEHFNEFSHATLTNLREYVDRKLENFEETPTPSPRKLAQPVSLNKPSFIENNSAFLNETADKSFEKLKQTLSKEIRSEIQESLRNFEGDAVFQEKIREFFAIKERVLGEKGGNCDSTQNCGSLMRTDAKNEKIVKEITKKSIKDKEIEDFSKENVKNLIKHREIEDFPKDNARKSIKHREIDDFPKENAKKSIKQKEIVTDFPKELAKNSKPLRNSKTNPRNSTENSVFSQETSHFPQKTEQNFDTSPKNPEKLSKSREDDDEISDLLRNYNEDFYENGLFDLIEELDQRELQRTGKLEEKPRKSKENRLTFQGDDGNTNESFEELQRNNVNFTGSSYTETDASVRFIQRKVREMEEESQRSRKKLLF